MDIISTTKNEATDRELGMALIATVYSPLFLLCFAAMIAF